MSVRGGPTILEADGMPKPFLLSILVSSTEDRDIPTLVTDFSFKLYKIRINPLFFLFVVQELPYKSALILLYNQFRPSSGPNEYLIQPRQD